MDSRRLDRRYAQERLYERQVEAELEDQIVLQRYINAVAIYALRQGHIVAAGGCVAVRPVSMTERVVTKRYQHERLVNGVCQE